VQYLPATVASVFIAKHQQQVLITLCRDLAVVLTLGTTLSLLVIVVTIPKPIEL
jgi:hypothetical protein